MNVFKRKIKHHKNLLLYKSMAILALMLFMVVEVVFLYDKMNSNNKRATYLEDELSFSETQQNKLISDGSLLVKADAMYSNILLHKNLGIESYVSDLNHLIQSVSNYYGLFKPIKVTVSYENVVVGTKSLVPLNISLRMQNIFDYTPMRLVFILFNNTVGTMNCNGLSISRKYTGSMFEQVPKNGYLFDSEVNIQWFVMLKPTAKSFHKTFFVNYKKVKDLEKIEHMYNMSTWDESFMIFPEDIEKLKDIQRSMR